MTMQTRRERQRSATIEEIKSIALAYLANEGTAGLSLGAIAREMGMTTPALYRYFENRQALETSLIIDAYMSMSAAIESAVGDVAEQDYETRFRVLANAYRDWALVHSGLYTLMFGNYVPDESAQTQIISAIFSAVQLLAELLLSAHTDGRLRIPRPYQSPPAQLKKALSQLAQGIDEASPSYAVLTLILVIWIRLHGLIWQELHGHALFNLLQSGDVYHMEVDVMAQFLGLSTN